MLFRSRILLLLAVAAAASAEAFRRDPGHAQWHHGAFHDVEDSIRADIRRMLHTRAEVLRSPHRSATLPLHLSDPPLTRGVCADQLSSNGSELGQSWQCGEFYSPVYGIPCRKPQNITSLGWTTRAHFA